MRRPLNPVPVLALAAAVVMIAAAPCAADVTGGYPRPRAAMNAAELRLALAKLQVVGSALFVGAHPDDENTALLSWLASGRMVRTAYLSLTRGDGGQNLIGVETGEQLGVIRTQELLAARRIDGAEQYFTRALDFGYSKNPDETLAIWGRDRILADAVYVIRAFRPDVIITRFPTDGGGGHGHHTASAILAEEAFAAAADPARYPEQLGLVKPWQAKRLVWNAFRFGNAPADTTRTRLRVDVGAFSPLLGRSYTEIAGESRSMHKSQGFGAAERRGTWEITFEHRLGERASRDLFEGVDLGWSRIQGGDMVAGLLEKAARSYDPDHPAAILPTLFAAHAAMGAIGPVPLVTAKRAELLEVIRSCAGLWVDAIAAEPASTPGSRVRVRLTVLGRSDAPLTLERIELPYGAVARLAGDPKTDPAARLEPVRARLEANRPLIAEAEIPLPADAPLTQPYWLRVPALAGSFQVAEEALIGLPENPPALGARVLLRAFGERVVFEVPVVHRSIDPVQGERYRALEIVPPATCRFDQGVYLFPDAAPREVRLTVECADTALVGTARLVLPDGWRATPDAAPVRLAGRSSEQEIRFAVTPAPGPAAAVVGAELQVGGTHAATRLVRIDHPHIPVQTLFPPAEARLVRADVRHTGSEIAYLMGSGDQVPDALRQMGFHVTLLSDEDVEHMDLGRFGAVIAGVRAYNTRPRLLALQPRLLEYVSNGGRLVVQYDTADETLKDRLGPWPFTIARDRVTVEGAEMRLLKPMHPLLVTPNRITPDDFSGWVQERGLYYAGSWDPKYETVLSANDPGETAKDGGLLFARHGQGVFIYTGLSWFRQLPAGVPGAWRLFANLVSPAR
jgi:LmbE family N-acetylglucosaminyl deacetylase